jgi:hypothetical protein
LNRPSSEWGEIAKTLWQSFGTSTWTNYPQRTAEQVHDQIHTLREMVRILSPDFEKKLMVQTAKLGHALSRDEVLSLLYGLDEF